MTLTIDHFESFLFQKPSTFNDNLSDFDSKSKNEIN